MPEDLIDLICGGLDLMASAFGKLFVPCVVGNNHETKKMQMKERVFTSTESTCTAASLDTFGGASMSNSASPRQRTVRLIFLVIVISLLEIDCVLWQR